MYSHSLTSLSCWGLRCRLCPVIPVPDCSVSYQTAVIEIIQSGYIPTASEVINLLGWALACGTVLLALESISIFLCVVIQNTGIVTGICCLYVFSGASVYLMLWSDMETVSIPLKFFVYGNPMYYWMNFSSCRTMGIIEHLPFYFIGCISLLIVGGLIMIRKEIK